MHGSSTGSSGSKGRVKKVDGEWRFSLPCCQDLKLLLVELEKQIPRLR
jgi:hypothetical protein